MADQVSDALQEMDEVELRDFCSLLIETIDDFRKLENTYHGVIARDGTGASWQNLRQGGDLDNYDAVLEELTGMAS